MSTLEPEPSAGARRRLTRAQRHRQLVDVAWRMVREEGSDALTLGRLAEQAGVTKPVVYSHFATRSALLAALYREFDARQNELIGAALAAAPPTLAGRADVIADAFVACMLAQGRELPGVLAALAGSPELEALRREGEAVFLENCRAALAPFAGPEGIGPAGLRAMSGAGEALCRAAMAGEITADEAREELRSLIGSMARRRAGN